MDYPKTISLKRYHDRLIWQSNYTGEIAFFWEFRTLARMIRDMFTLKPIEEEP